MIKIMNGKIISNCNFVRDELSDMYFCDNKRILLVRPDSVSLYLLEGDLENKQYFLNKQFTIQTKQANEKSSWKDQSNVLILIIS